MHRPIRFAVLFPFLALCACAVVPGRRPAWEQFKALDTPDKLGGCAIGDLDPARPLEEIGVVSSSGNVHVVWRNPGELRFGGVVAAELPGEMIQCAAGDLDGRRGDELYAVGVAAGTEDDGGPGAAWRIRKDGEGWEATRILDTDALLHAVAVGDADPGHPGAELVVAGFDRRVVLLVPDGDGFRTETIAELSGDAKGAAIGPGGVVVACADGTLVRCRKRAGDWSSEVLASYGSPLARVAVSRTGDVLVSADDGVLRLVTGGRTVPIEGWSDRLRGAVFADVDPFRAGLEMATAGYDGRVWVVTLDGEVGSGDERATRTPVARDSDRLHHLATGTLPEFGVVLAACGYSGKLWIVDRVEL